MPKQIGVPPDYYKTTWCVKCRVQMAVKELKAREKEKFLRLCDKCNIVMKEALKKCLPLMQKFSRH